MTKVSGGRRLGRPTLDEAVTLRETFLQQALVMLGERGVHGFSMDALAKASGVTKRTIYRQYESKAALIEAVVEQEVGRLVDNQTLSDDAAAPPLDQLEKWASRFFRYLSQESAQRVGLLLRVASHTEPWAARMLEVWLTRLLNSAGALVMAAQDNKQLRQADPEMLVSLLIDLMDGVFNSVRFNFSTPVVLSEEALERQFQRRWLAFLQLARPDWASVGA